MRRNRLLLLAMPLCLIASMGSSPALASNGPGVGVVPQGIQSDQSYAASAAAHGVTNTFVTDQQTSCYRPEAPFTAALTGNGYTGMTACPGATTGEDTGNSVQGPYPTQTGSNPGYPADGPMLVKDHSESDIRVDPTNPRHLIGMSKWAVSAEGYNHLLGFFESFDGGATWPVQGHVPGYEGWTDNTDPIGAFDSYGNFYTLVLPYQFYYNSDGSHNYQTNQNKEPNPTVPAEAITASVRKHGATSADDWSSNRSGQMDVVAPYPAKGKEPDKQWLTIDTNPASPFLNRIYAMWTLFNGISAVPYMSWATAYPNGTHSAWSAPEVLPTAGSNPQGDTYLQPHVDGTGAIYTTVTNFEPKQGFCCLNIIFDRSSDGGVTWQSISNVVTDVIAPPATYPNTSFRDGIADTFAIGPRLPHSSVYPLYVAWEDYSAGVGNVILSASYDGGSTWSSPIQVNDNANPNVDEFQPNLAVAANGTVSVAFYDRRLACPTAAADTDGSTGLALDSNRPYGATNYCVNASLQFYGAGLGPIGNNIRISLHTWDPELNSMKPFGINASTGFIGDYFGNITAGRTDFTTSVSTYGDGGLNGGHYQQQVVAAVAVP